MGSGETDIRRSERAPSARARTPLRRIHVALFGAGGAAWLVLHASGLLGPLADATFVVVGLATIAAVTIGVRRNAPERRAPWMVIIAAFVVWIIGGGLREQYETLGDLSADRVLVPDIFSLTGYVLLIVGSLILLHRRYDSREYNLDAALDATIVSSAAALLAWVVFVAPALDATEVAPAPEILLITYPMLSVAVASMIARLAFGARSGMVPAFFLLLASMVLLLIGDVIYLFVEIGSFSPSVRLRDLPYAAAFLTFGAGVLHPSVRAATQPMPVAPVRPDSWRVLLVTVSLIVPIGVTVGVGVENDRDRVAVLFLSVLLSGAAIARIGRALRAQQHVDARLLHATTHDELTLLPNRSYLQAHLDRVLSAAVEHGQLVGALVLDIDRFKVINDARGHQMGDGLLAAFAGRLRSTVPEHDLVVHNGADEFIVVCRADGAAEIHQLAEELRCACRLPFLVRGQEIRATVSVGCAMVSPSAPASRWATIVEDADAALAEAKVSGRDRVQVYEPAMRQHLDQRLLLEQELRRAIEQSQLSVVYQPIVQLPHGTVDAYEALVRWFHPDLGWIPPDRFIPVAEELGLIGDLGSFVLDEAVSQLVEWRRAARDRAAKMSVNVSALQVSAEGFAESVIACLDRHGLDAGSLQLEITESLLTEEAEVATTALRVLREAGVRIAIDDFGTGYSSLAHLKRYPVDVVKIDKSFVDSLGNRTSSDDTLITAIEAMATALGLTTVAEGVEEAEQAHRLFELGVRQAQGYYFSRPLPAGEFHRFQAGERSDDDGSRAGPGRP